MTPAGAPIAIGGYAVFGEIASGGMGSVHLGRKLGAGHFPKMVAIKRLHPHLARDPEFSRLFVREARIAARLSHPNVVATFDAVADGGELLLVMEHVHGATLGQALAGATARGERCPPRVAAAIVAGVLRGLHHAHVATRPTGEPIGIVHRDVCPQNILVGTDGLARVLDFGIAKADGHTATRDGVLRGKLPFMAPELFCGERATVRSDIHAVGACLWQALTGAQLFAAETDAAIMAQVLTARVPPVSDVVPGLEAFDAVLARALARAPSARHESALAMALALEQCVGVASPTEVGRWLGTVAEDLVAARGRLLAAVEQSPDPAPVAPAVAPTPQRRAPPLYALAAAVGGLVVVVAAGAVVRQRPVTAEARAAVAVAPPEPAASVQQVLPAASAAIPALPAPAPVTSAGPKESPRGHTPARPVTSPRAKDCDPPYVIEEGRKRYKLDCLRRGGGT